MNIVFFTQEDPFYVKIFFDEFLKNFKSPEEIKALVISRVLAKKSVIKLARQMYDFYGPRDFIRIGLQYIYLKYMGRKPVKKSKSDKIPKTYTLQQTANVYGLNVIERSDLNSKDFQEFIRQYDADLFISVASSIIFKEELVKIPKIDCINIHSAPLPKYRGMTPNFWQLYHGEKEAGITVHRIDSGIDTGEIITQHFVPIENNKTLNDLIVKTKKEGARLIIKVIEDFRNGRVTYKKMEGVSSYFSFPNRKDVIEFKKKGKRLL